MNREAIALTVASGALGIVAALTLSAPSAVADPGPPAPAPEPAPAAAPPNPFPWLVPPPAAEPAAAPADPAISPPVPAPGPTPNGTVQAVAAPAAPPDGMPHLSSLENLPPGTTETPPDASQSRGLGYLRDIWHAYQTQEVNGRDALLLLTQRPLDANSAPPPGMPANPTPPLPPAPPADPAAPLLPAPAP